MDAGAEVLARNGYEGTTINEVARQAGVTSGAIYAHFEGKSDLLQSVVTEHRGIGREQWDQIDPTKLLDVLEHRAVRRGLPSPFHGAMLIEAIVAAKRDPAVAKATRTKVRVGQEKLREAIGAAQAAGACDPDVSPSALARLSLILTLGSVLARSLNLPDVDPDEWTDLIHTILEPVRAQSEGEQPS
jgi:AcrR family transcriptional regulator